MKKKIVLGLLIISFQIIAMEEPENCLPGCFSFAREIFTDAWVSIRLKYQEASAGEKLFAAIQNKNVTEGATQIAELLRENAEIIDKVEDNNGMTPLLAAAIQGDAGIMAQLLHRNPLPQVDRCTHGRVAMIKMKKNSELIDLTGFTPLMAAARLNHINIVRQLLHAGAKKELKDFNQKTALDYATASGYINVADLLR